MTRNEPIWNTRLISGNSEQALTLQYNHATSHGDNFMKRSARLFLFFVLFCIGCGVQANAQMHNSQNHAASKMEKQQLKAQKKYAKAQRKAQRKMEKYDRKHTHDPNRPR